MTSSPDILRTVVADDDEPMRMLLGIALDLDERFEVVGRAADGQEALDVISDVDPDLLVLDMEMPRVNGLEVLARLDGRARPTVVVLSAVGTTSLIEQALRSGAVAFVDKGAAAADLPGTLHDAATRQPVDPAATGQAVDGS